MIGHEASEMTFETALKIACSYLYLPRLFALASAIVITTTKRLMALMFAAITVSNLEVVVSIANSLLLLKD